MVKMNPAVQGQMLDSMVREVRELNRDKGWYEEDRSVGDMVALLHAEVSEMLEAYREGKFADQTVLTQKNDGKPAVLKPEGFKVEAADVFIRLLDMCARYDIDLWAEFRKKMEYNWTRPYKHGGKTL